MAYTTPEAAAAAAAADTTPWPSAQQPSATAPRPRFLSEADCHDIAARLARVTRGGGYTNLLIFSTWTGNVRWARNRISTSGEVRNNVIFINRNINGAQNGWTIINETSDPALVAAVREAERIAALRRERANSDLVRRYRMEPYQKPALFSEATYQLDAKQRAGAARQLLQSAEAAGMLSAGYIEVSAHSQAMIDSFGQSAYYPYTHARYSVTVRTPQGTGSGWAGLDHHDWAKIDGAKLSQLALDKCLKSRDPVAIEPGRYTTILEPQAVGDFVGRLAYGWRMDALRLECNERSDGCGRGAGPFFKSNGVSRGGEKVMDERITISADPADPELGFPPFMAMGNIEPIFQVPVYHPTTWVEKGVLTHLGYERPFGVDALGQNTGLPNAGALRISVAGVTTSVEEMIATTKRGLLVTRFDQVQELEFGSLLCQGYTRDGLWLIENGKISKPVKNLMFTEAILFALNNVEQLGVPQRVFHPDIPAWWSIPQPVVVPAMKIKDFSFTSLSDAV